MGFGDAVLDYSFTVDNPVGVVDNIYGLVGESATSQAYEVYATITYGLLSGHDVWWNILVSTRAALHHHVTAHMGKLMEETSGGNRGKIIDYHLTGQLRGVAYDTAVTYYAVVPDMHVLHQEVSVTHDCLSLRGSTTADGNVLADGIVIANFTGSLLTLELQVLWLCGDAGAWEELIIVADTRSEVNCHAIQQSVVVTDDDILVNHAERTNDVSIAEFCLGVDDGCGMYLIHTLNFEL